jgi:uncharacterized protein
MLFAVMFEDNTQGAGIRRQHMPAHLAFLESHGGAIRAAGPLLTPTGDPAGGLWLVEADAAEAVDALVRDDPFWSAGLRRSVRILRWSQVFAGGRRQV